MIRVRFRRPGHSSLWSAALLVLVTLPLPAATVSSKTEDAEETAEALQEKREQEFMEMLSGVKLTGSFTANDSPADQPLTEESYTITKVSKISDHLFLFDARVQYAGRDVRVPIPLNVYWADDTPVITLTDMTIPGLGTYTARVLFYRGKYVGTWSGKTHGGHMFGRYTKIEQEPPVTKDAADSNGK